MYTAREKLLIVTKWLASLFHSDWKIGEYPVRTRLNGENAKPGEEWLAQILNWPGPVGVGASKEEAIGKLSEGLESIRTHRKTAGERMPRPGRNVPIQFAPSDRVLSDPSLHDDFLTRST